MEQPGKRRRGRPKKRFMDVVRGKVQALGVAGGDAGDGKGWKWYRSFMNTEKEQLKEGTDP